jgi:hypothetical protein
LPGQSNVCVSPPVIFTYNADSRRVQKQTSTQTRNLVYNFEKVLQEADGW